jgi:hypothetical protein
MATGSAYREAAPRPRCAACGEPLTLEATYYSVEGETLCRGCQLAASLAPRRPMKTGSPVASLVVEALAWAVFTTALTWWLCLFAGSVFSLLGA